MTKTIQILAAALLVSTSVVSTLASSPASAQEVAGATKTIQITGYMEFDGGLIIKHISNNGMALKIEDMSTIADAKLMKLKDAAERKGSITVVVRGNIIVDVL